MNVDPKGALEILSQLIRIRTLLPKGDELDIVKYIRTFFEGSGVKTSVYNLPGNRASMTAVLEGEDRGVNVGLAGHLDTFPILGEEQWEHPPFSADYAGGRVYGRGASNMKGGVTAMLLAFLYFMRMDKKPPCTITLCLMAGGDDASLPGARGLAANGALNGLSEIIFGEPTDNRIGIAQRGGVWLKVSVTGRASYACIPGVGIDAIAAFISLHKKVSEYINQNKYEHPYLGTPLCTITQIHGGVAVNSIAPECDGTIDIRLLPLQDNDDVVQFALDTARKIEERYEALKISIEVDHSNPTVAMPEDAQIIRDFEKLLKARGESTEKTGLFYYTDACALIPTLGIPFIFFGPGRDIYNIQKDESIELASVVKAAEVYISYIQGKG